MGATFRLRLLVPGLAAGANIGAGEGDEHAHCYQVQHQGLGSQQEPTTHEEILAQGPGAARRAAE